MPLTYAISRRLANHESPDSLRGRLRRRRIGPLIEMIDAVHAEYGFVRILDIGGTRKYWSIFPQDVLIENSVHITVVNIPGSQLPANDALFTFTVGDGCNLKEHRNNSFHIVHSNSVIEHVGDWEHMRAFAAEIRRLAPNYFVQTPYFWFPVEPHFMCPLFHWLPEPIRVGLMLRFNLGWWPRRQTVGDAVRAVQGSRLLDKRMFRFLFPDAKLVMEKWLLLPKSMIVVRRSAT
jgi:hypothetical protein